MGFPKQMKDIVYNLLQEPTLDKFRDFIKAQTGEHDAIDFKSQWITGDQLAKEMLAMANSGGGVIVFGIAEQSNHTATFNGLKEIRDPATISNEIKNFITSDLKYEVYDFAYTASEYPALEGKLFQMLVVEDTPEYIPFLAKKESGHLKPNAIYVRRGTSCEIANQEELRTILNRRMTYIHPLKGEPLSLEEHLKQLKVLYNNIQKENVYYKNDWPAGLAGAISALVGAFSKGEKTVEPNPLYPDEEYEEFVARMIVEKKSKIKRVLDLY